MVLCLVVNCGNKTGSKKPKSSEGIGFFRVPSVITNQGKLIEELTSERRRRWISAISREDLTEKILSNDRVCSEHFVSGKPAQQWDKHNIDWVPTLKLGHSKKSTKDLVAAAERTNRALSRRKRAQNFDLGKNKEKLKKLEEPGQLVEKIFSAIGPTNEERKYELDRDSYSHITTQLSDRNEDLLGSDLSNMCIEEAPVKCEAETQTSEFEYLFKETARQEPFTENYFMNNDDKVKFYTGLPCFDVLKTTFDFISPHIRRRSLTLSLFQEFIIVLMKLRLTVPFQDLAYRFDASLSTVSKIFQAWMTVMDIRLSALI